MKISVIVPIYNTEKYLHKCIDSILNQTFKDLEVILVDDGSTDSSGAICDEYAKKDERVVVIHKENGGQATARNIGLDIAKGEYISFIDSDDYIENDMYESMLDAIERTGADVAMCGKLLVSEDYKFTQNRFVLNDEVVWESNEVKRRFLLSDCIGSSPCDKLMKKELFQENDPVRFPKGYICEDLVPIFKMLCKTKKLVHVGKGYYNYYQRKNSTSRGDVLQEKTYGMLYYPAQIKDIVNKEYAELYFEADYYYAVRLGHFLTRLSSKHNKREYKRYRKEYLTYKKNIKTYGNKYEKRLYLLIKLNLYFFLRKIKRILKK